MEKKRGSKRGPGRPPMAKGEQMNTIVAVRVKPAEKKHLIGVAKAAKKSLTEWAREALLVAGSAP